MISVLGLVLASFAVVSSFLASQSVGGENTQPCDQNSPGGKDCQNDVQALLNAVKADASVQNIMEKINKDSAIASRIKDTTSQGSSDLGSSNLHELDKSDNADIKKLDADVSGQKLENAFAENEEKEFDAANQWSEDEEESEEHAADELKDAFAGWLSSRRRRRYTRRRRFINLSFFTRRRRSSSTTSGTWRPNGCSVPMGLSAPFKSTFTPACNKHDTCYYYRQLSRLGCDNVFLTDMYTACNRKNIFTYLTCYQAARAYYSATRVGGASHYGPNGR